MNASQRRWVILLGGGALVLVFATLVLALLLADPRGQAAEAFAVLGALVLLIIGGATLFPATRPLPKFRDRSRATDEPSNP